MRSIGSFVIAVFFASPLSAPSQAAFASYATTPALAKEAPKSHLQMRVTSGWPTYNSLSPNIGRADTLDAGGGLVRSVPFGREISKQYTVTAPASDGGWYIAQYLDRGPGQSRIEISAYHFDGSLNTSFGDDGLKCGSTECGSTVTHNIGGSTVTHNIAGGLNTERYGDTQR